MLGLGLGLGLQRQNVVGFNPSDYGNVYMDINPAISSSITTTGGRVTQIDDQSGNGYHWTATGALRPTDAENSALTFDGSHGMTINSGANTLPTNDNFEVYCVVQFDNLSTGNQWQRLLQGQVGLSSRSFIRFDSVDDELDGGSNSSFSQDSLAFTPNTTNTFVFSLRRDGSTAYVGVGDSYSTGVSSGDVTLNALYFGYYDGSSDTDFFEGKLLRCVIFDEDIGTSNRTELIGHLSNLALTTPPIAPPAPEPDIGTLTATDSDSSGANATSYTFSGKDFGSASADRKIIVGIVGRSSSANTISSVTIGGVSATSIAGVVDENNTAASYYVADVPSGTSGDVVVTFSATNLRCGIVVYGATGIKSIVSHSTDIEHDSGNPAMQVDALEDSFVLGLAYCDQDGSASNWTGLDEDFDLNAIESQITVTSASKYVETPDSTYDTSVAFTGNVSEFYAAIGITIVLKTNRTPDTLNIAWEGDSRTTGTGHGSGTSIDDLVLNTLSSVPNMTNNAVGGQQTSTALGSFTAEVTAAYDSSYDQNILVYHTFGINDFRLLRTFEDVRDDTISMLATAAGLGYKVHVSTVLPRDTNTAAQNAELNEYNQWLRDNWEDHADALLDYFTNDNLGIWSSTYYNDVSHPNTAGYNEMATMLTTSLQALIDA